MRAATTKIPHLLYEKDLLKTPKAMNDFIYNLWFIYNDCGLVLHDMSTKIRMLNILK